jgi:hypothetical protein
MPRTSGVSTVSAVSGATMSGAAVSAATMTTAAAPAGRNRHRSGLRYWGGAEECGGEQHSSSDFPAPHSATVTPVYVKNLSGR